jgi:hypothetical protein
LVANLNSFALDWTARQKIGGSNLSLYVMEQLPVLPPSAYRAEAPWDTRTLGDWVRPYLAELVATDDQLLPFARSLGWTGPPFRWVDSRRENLRAELDAAYCHLYGLGREEVIHVLNSFWIIADRDRRATGDFATLTRILDAYNAMTVASPSAPFATRLDPPPGDPRAAHQPRPGDEPGHWIPWSEVLARAPQASSTMRSSNIATALSTKPSPPSPTRPVPVPEPSLFATDPTSTWQPEAAIAPNEIVMGDRVRHRAKGEGTVLSVRTSGKSTELLIRYDTTGESWIVFGYGVLEFQQ